MSFISILVGGLAALVLALLIGAGFGGGAILIIAGLAGGVLAGFLPRGSEQVYWGFVALTALLFVLSLFGLSVGGLVMMIPLALAFGYFAARLAMRFTGRHKSLI